MVSARTDHGFTEIGDKGRRLLLPRSIVFVRGASIARTTNFFQEVGHGDRLLGLRLRVVLACAHARSLSSLARTFLCGLVGLRGLAMSVGFIALDQERLGLLRRQALGLHQVLALGLARKLGCSGQSLAHAAVCLGTDGGQFPLDRTNKCSC
jgi:hypothetical protein